MKFSGKTAFVAGAGGGMGLAIACQLIERGVNVCMADLKPRPDEISEGPGKSIYVQADLSDQIAVEESFNRALVEFSGIDYLVNTLGVLWLDKDKSAVDIDLSVWDQVMNINLRSMVLLVKYAVPELKKSGRGSMVHFSSIDALKGDPVPQDAYGASKAALIRLSKSLAIQFASDKIRSNVILPGPALTPMQQRWQGKPELQNQIAERIPLGRLGNAEDMANACLFLLSDNAGFITGTELIVDGGITAHP
jgi:NAD(P)-dependent dehydrogenase (short-subunit alcohol dehydrogenase family)